MISLALEARDVGLTGVHRRPGPDFLKVRTRPRWYRGWGISRPPETAAEHALQATQDDVNHAWSLAKEVGRATLFIEWSNQA
jgi:hypothetical protein